MQPAQLRLRGQRIGVGLRLDTAPMVGRGRSGWFRSADPIDALQLAQRRRDRQPPPRHGERRLQTGCNCVGVVWLGLGVAGLYTGLQASRWPIVGVSLFALLYGALWVRVALDGRLLNRWQDLFAPRTKAPGDQQRRK